MKDVEKTNVERNNSHKRIRRRRRWNNLYGLAVILLVLTVGLTICCTFLFNISEIRVSGESDIYSAEEIVSASGINQGDNLLRLDSEECEKMILDKLLYVETAEISKKYPSSIDIKVTRCVPAFNICYDGGSLLVSRKGKILEDNGNGNITNGLPVIQGLEPSDLMPGKNIQSGNEHKNEAFQAFVKSFDSEVENEITAIDLTDEFSIIVSYKNGIIFKMGGWNDIEYKLDLAASVMEDESVKGKKGYLTMIGTNQCSFRTSDSPASVPGNIEPSKSDKTDENSSDESNPEQEAMFSEYNNQNNPDSAESTSEPDTSASDDYYSDDYSDWDNGYDANDYGYDNSYDYGYDENYDWNDYGGDYSDDYSY